MIIQHFAGYYHRNICNKHGDLEEIHAIAWKGFSKKDPFAAEFFANIKLTTEELSSFMTAMKDARMDEEEIARKWRDEHRQLVDSWIPKSDNFEISS